MDRKKGRAMMKKGIIFFALGILIILVTGCQTVKGAAQGAATGGAEGAKQDWQDLQQLDAKMREVLW